MSTGSRFHKGDLVTYNMRDGEVARLGEVIEVRELDGKAYTLLVWAGGIWETVLESRCTLRRPGSDPPICNRELKLRCVLNKNHHGTCRPNHN